MSPTEFKAAVEKIIGIPPNRPSGEPFWWMLDTPSARLGVEIDGSRILMNFYDTEALPGLGENPATGQWNINGRDFNDDPEAMLRELARRLARAGYVPPKAEPCKTCGDRGEIGGITAPDPGGATEPCPECNSASPVTDYEERRLDAWSDGDRFVKSATCRRFEKEAAVMRKCIPANDSDSIVASCNCNTKTPEVQHHKAGCKYRLIMERNAFHHRAMEAEAEVARLTAIKCPEWNINEHNRLREEIAVLRQFGNKDCTAMADEELKARRAATT